MASSVLDAGANGMQKESPEPRKSANSWVEPETCQSQGPEAPKMDPELVYLKVMKGYAMRPKLACGLACGCHFFLIFVFLIAMLAAGNDWLNMGTDVALHIWKDQWQMAMDAVHEGDKICSYDLSAEADQPQQTWERLPEGSRVYQLDIVYNSKDGNMLTLANLAKVKELEDFIANHPDYPKFCLRSNATGQCAPPRSVAMACMPSLCGRYGSSVGCNSPLTGGCDSVNSVPVGVYQCMNPSGCTRSQWQIDNTFMDKKLLDYSRATFMRDMPQTDFLLGVEAAFGPGERTSSATRSVFKFGFPLEGYTKADDRPKEQQMKVENFMEDAYYKKLSDFNGQSSDQPFLIGFVGGSLTDKAINSLLMGDFALVALAFVVVLLYCSVMLRSFTLGILALGQIFACFFTGFIFYRLFFMSSFFGTFHIMAIFLLLGVGVDDVFVFIDHFQAAVHVDERYKDDIWGRLSWTWKHASIAMGVTSLTTMVSFMCNASSSFPGIGSFGVFAGSLVMVLYISMITYWPAVVALNYTLFRDKPFLCGVIDKCNKCLANTSPEQVEQAEQAELEKGSQGEDSEEKGAITRFFENHFSYFILNHRAKVLVVFLGVSIFMFTRLPGLEPEKKAPEFLKEDHPIRQYTSVMKDKFVRGGGNFNTKVKIVGGFASEPISKDGTDPTGTGDNQGTVNWHPAFSLPDGRMNAPNILKTLPCWMQLCAAAEVKDPARNTGGLPAYPMKGCIPRRVWSHINLTDNTGLQARWHDITVGGNVNEWFRSVNDLIRSDPAFLPELGDYTFAEKVGNDIRFRFFVSEITLTSNTEMSYNEGNKLAERWDAWLKNQMTTGACAAVSGTLYTPFLMSPSFANFKVAETLYKEMIQGICISIAVAFVILILVTGNVIVGFFAGFTIGMILVWVMAMIPIFGWELGMVENIILVMVPGLSVDFTAHLAESYNQAKYDDREHRVVHALEHSGVSIVQGALSTTLAGMCLCGCQIVFFTKFGIMLIFTVMYAVLFSLFFFSSIMALIGPRGEVGDWHKYISPKVVPKVESKKLRVSQNIRASRSSSAIQVVPEPNAPGAPTESSSEVRPVTPAK